MYRQPDRPAVFNKSAIASLVMAIPLCVPFLQIAGVLVGRSALTQIRLSGGREKGRGIALAGVTICSLWIVATIAGAVLYFSGGLNGLMGDELNKRARNVTREDFVTAMSDAAAVDPDIKANFSSPEMMLGVLHAIQGLASCTYDIYATEPALLAELYKDPLAEEVPIPKVLYDRNIELSAEVEAQCAPVFEAEVRALQAGG